MGGVLKDGPVILLPGENQPLPASIAAQIKRLDPQSVVALGGAQAVSDQRLYQLAAGRQAARLGGKTREETSLIIARQAFKTADSLYLAQAAPATGGASPDALTAASLRDGPIVLINPASPTFATTRQLAADLQVKRVVALGGNNVIPTEPLSSVAGNLATTRLGGSDRYETSRQKLSVSTLIPTGPTWHAAISSPTQWPGGNSQTAPSCCCHPSASHSVPRLCVLWARLMPSVSLPWVVPARFARRICAIPCVGPS